MKEDPLEEAAKKYAEIHLDVSGNLGKYLVKAVFQDGAKYQQERSYSEEDMISFANFKTSNLMTHCDKKGMYLGTKVVLEIWFNQFKKNEIFKKK